MARYVKHDKHGPALVKAGGEEVWICRCGLTSNENGTCDQSHHKTVNEEKGKLYVYDKDFNKMEVDVVETDSEEDSDEHVCACGGNCGCGHSH